MQYSTNYYTKPRSLGATLTTTTTVSQADYDELKRLCEERVKLLNAQITELQAKLNIQTTQLNTLSLTTKERDQALLEIKTLKLQIEKLTNELKIALSDLSNLKSETSLAISTLETKIANLQKLYESQVQQFNDLMAKNALTLQERDQAINDISQLKARIEQLIQELNALRSSSSNEIQSLKSKLESLDAQVMTCENKSLVSNRSISDLTNKLLDATNAFNNLSATSTAETDLLSQKINELSSRIIELESIRISTKTAIESKDAQIQSLNNNIQKLNAMLKSNQVDTKSLSELMSNNNALNAQLTEIKESYARLQSSMSLTSDENARLSAQITDLNTKLSALQASENAIRISKTQEIEDLNQQLAECRILTTPPMQTSESGLKIELLQAEYDKLQAENEKLKQALQDKNSSQFATTDSVPTFTTTESEKTFPWLWVVVGTVVVGSSVYVMSNRKTK